MNCIKYTTKVQYHSICHDILEIFIPTKNIAFHHVNTIIGRTLITIETSRPRSDKTETIFLSPNFVENIMQIHKNRIEINKLESEMKDELEIGLYSQTVLFDNDISTEQLKKEVIELTGYSKSKVNTMTLDELKEIVAEYT